MKFIIGNYVRHTHGEGPSEYSEYYLISSAGGGKFVLINLLYGTRAAEPTHFHSNHQISLSLIESHMGSLITKSSRVELLSNCKFSYEVVPATHISGEIKVGRGQYGTKPDSTDETVEA